MSYEQELEDLRTLVEAQFANPELIAWPGDTSFSPPAQSGSSSSPAFFVDMDIDYAGSSWTDFAGGRMRTLVLEPAVCVETVATADNFARKKVDALEAVFAANTVAGMTYRCQESYPTASFVWQKVWWRVELRLEVWRFET